jgi:Asp-tRNA(Asn)/Glu-tRNA(Gln) amidotransferase A subunit family amidase
MYCGAYQYSKNSIMSSAQLEGATAAHEPNATVHNVSNDETSVESFGELEPNEIAEQINENGTSNPSHNAGLENNSTTETASREHGNGIPGLALVLAGGAIAAGLYLLKKKILSSDSPNEPSEALINQLFLVNLKLNTPSISAAATTAPSPKLAEKRLVVSDRIDIQGIKTRFGSSEWQSSNKLCTISAPIVDQLIQDGAIVIGTLPTWPLGLNPSLFNPLSSSEKLQSRIAREIGAIPNPSAPKGHTHGGGEYGPAVAIAAGAADLCVAVDEVGSALIPAACCGVYAYRPTSGVLQLEGAVIASSTLGTTCLLASDPALLIRAAQTLKVPGGGNNAAGIVSKYLVAEDLFALCDEEVKKSAPAVVAAVKRWAGPEHAQGLCLCDWLYHRIPSLAKFMPSSMTSSNNNNNNNNNNSEEDNSSSSSLKRTSDVLSALTTATAVICKWEWLRSPSGRWASRKHNHATSAVSSVASGISDNDNTSQSTVELPREIVTGLLNAHLVSEKMYLDAIVVADELSQGMRGALQEGYVFVVPTTPGPAPKINGKNCCQIEERFRKLSEQFAALSSLAGVPQIAMPMPSPANARGQHYTGEKKAPLSISMVTLQRRDLILVKAAAKLGPMLKEEIEKLAASSRSTKNATGSPVSVGGDKQGNGGSGSSSASSGSKKKYNNGGVSEEHSRAAEVAKEEGNAAFKAGRYDEAVKRYSEAIQYKPHAAVYFSNRAMAYLKLGIYTAAEADCDAALELDPSMVKALLRRGSAQLAQGRLVEARNDFERVVYLEPRNRQALEELKRLTNIEAPDSSIAF